MNKISPIKSFILEVSNNDLLISKNNYRQFINDIKHFTYDDFINEYKKIQEKKSSLSLRSRAFVERLVLKEMEFALNNDTHRIENGEIVPDN